MNQQSRFGGPEWGLEQALSLGGYLYGSRKRLRGPMALSDAVGRCLAGGVVHLDEGAYFVYNGFDFQWDDLTVVGEGERTVIWVMTGDALVWSGDRGRLRDVLVKLDPAIGTRMAAYMLRITGTYFTGERFAVEDANNAIEIVNTGTHCTLDKVIVRDQASVGILGSADFHAIHHCRVSSSAAVSEVTSTGAGSSVLSNWCIGGNFNVVGAGSTALDNHV